MKRGNGEPVPEHSRKVLISWLPDERMRTIIILFGSIYFLTIRFILSKFNLFIICLLMAKWYTLEIIIISIGDFAIMGIPFVKFVLFVVGKGLGV